MKRAFWICFFNTFGVAIGFHQTLTGLQARPIRNFQSHYDSRHVSYRVLTKFPHQKLVFEGERRSANLLLEALPLSNQVVTGLAVNTLWPFVLTALGQKSLTTAGLVHAGTLGAILWCTLGLKGWSVMVVYFLCGSAVTKVRLEEKQKLGIAEERGGQRGPKNVWGSAFVGALCALGTVVFPEYQNAFKLGYVASIATKLSDTFGSEIGKAFGKTTILITTLKPVPKGTEGAVSVEGTLAGVLGSIIICAWSFFVGVSEYSDIGPILVAAFLACNVESFLGATTQGKTKYLTNEVINVINTFLGALFSISFQLLMNH